MKQAVPGHVPLLLFLLFFLGLAITILTFVDLRWSHWLLTPAATHTSLATHGGGSPS